MSKGELGDSAAETLQRFTAQAASTTSPPGPKGSWVGETIVHAEDIRRPLVIAHTCAPAAVRRVADFYQGSAMAIGAKNRSEPVTLRGSDTDRSRAGGDWPVARAGRGHDRAHRGPDDLEGPGVDVLRPRD